MAGKRRKRRRARTGRFDGDKVRQLRERAGWTQQKLAAELRRAAIKTGVLSEQEADDHYSASTVSKWELVSRNPNYTTVWLMAQVFGVAMEDFAE